MTAKMISYKILNSEKHKCICICGLHFFQGDFEVRDQRLSAVWEILQHYRWIGSCPPIHILVMQKEKLSLVNVGSYYIDE